MAALTSHTTTPSPPTHANPAGACPLTLPCGTVLWLLPGRAVWWPQARSLFVADVHFGKAASFRHAGQPVPTGTTADNIARLDAEALQQRREELQARIASLDEAEKAELRDLLQARLQR